MTVIIHSLNDDVVKLCFKIYSNPVHIVWGRCHSMFWYNLGINSIDIIYEYYTKTLTRKSWFTYFVNCLSRPWELSILGYSGLTVDKKEIMSTNHRQNLVFRKVCLQIFMMCRNAHIAQGYLIFSTVVFYFIFTKWFKTPMSVFAEEI